MIDDRIWLRHSIAYSRLYSNEDFIRECENIEQLEYDWLIDNDWDADSLEYYITKNSHVIASEHLLSLHPPLLWISRLNQMEQISSSVESIVVQGEVGRRDKSFNLSNLPSLISLEMGFEAFSSCDSIVFESMNDWMNDEWDLTQLQSIIIGSHTFQGINYQPIVYSVKKENELIMRSMNEKDIDRLDLPALTLFKGKGNFYYISIVQLESDDWWLYLT